MLDFDEELKRFKPSLDVDDVEDTLNGQDLTDIIDMMNDMRNPLNLSTVTKEKSKRT
ncbi:MAG: hypothetical protein UHN88_03490 [Eubacterium sp.]|nr:hypothetical protein [Eubacterium sp.]